MDDAALLRYSRHILLDELGPDAQAKLRGAHALVVGAGGLGAPAAQFLAAAGVGHAHALRRRRRRPHQPAAPDPVRDGPDVGARKVDAARARLGAINPDVAIARCRERVGAAALAPLVRAADVVLDCSDNFATRHAVNRACVRRASRSCPARRCASTARSRSSTRATRDAPCYHCLFGEGDELEETRCATMGVFAPLVGIVGSMQAAEALKLLAGVGASLAGRLLLVDALDMQQARARVPRDPDCAVCRVMRETDDAPMTHSAVAVFAAAAASLVVASSRAPRRAGPRLPGQADWTAIRTVIDDQLAALKAGDGERRSATRPTASASSSAMRGQFMRMVRTGYAALLRRPLTRFLEGAVVDGVVDPAAAAGAARQHRAGRALHDAEGRRGAGASPAASSRRRPCARLDRASSARGLIERPVRRGPIERR